MMSKKLLINSLFKFSSYILLVLVSLPVTAIPNLYPESDFHKEALLQEMTTLSLKEGFTQPSLSSIRNSGQANQVLQNLEKNFRETGELRNILTVAPRLIELLPDELNVKYMYAIALGVKGDIVAAKKIVKGQSKVGVSAYASMAQAIFFKANGELNEASAAASRAISIDSTHPYPYNILGQVFASRKNYDNAVESFQAAVNYEPNFAAGWSNLGSAQLLMGNSDDAEKAFSTAINLSADYCAPRVGRAVIFVSNGYVKNATTDLEACIKAQPEHFQANKQLAALYIEESRLEEAKKVAELLSKRDPVFSNTVLADIYLRQNKPAKARDHLLAIKSLSAQHYYLLSFCDMLEGKQENAIEHIKSAEGQKTDAAVLKIANAVFSFYTGQSVDQKSLKLLRQDAGVGKLTLFLEGNMQASSGNMKDAHQYWSQADGLLSGFTLSGVPLETISKSITVDEQRHLALGVLYYLKSFYSSSLIEFNKAIDINPQSFLANYFVAVASANIKESNIVKHLKKSLEYAPNFFPSNYMLAENYLQNRDVDSAIKHYKIASNSKADGGVLMKLGLLYDQKGLKEDTVATYRTFIDNYVDNFIGYNQLAWVYARDGDQLDEGLRLAKKANKLQPGNASVNDTLGWIYYQKNKYGEAKRYLSRANKLSNGNNADILFHMASLEYALGETREAKTLVEKALKKSKSFESVSQARELLRKLKVVK